MHGWSSYDKTLATKQKQRIWWNLVHRVLGWIIEFHSHQSIDIEFIWIWAALSLLVITVNCFSAYRNRKAVHNALHTISESSMHNAKPHPLCKHWKQFGAYDQPLIGWRKSADTIDQRFRFLPVHLSSPVMTTCYDLERCVTQIHVNTCQCIKVIKGVTWLSRSENDFERFAFYWFPSSLQIRCFILCRSRDHLSI